MPDHSAIAPDLIQARTAAMSPSRPPPKRIKVLLPVWGYDFTKVFLRVSLPTLLAPGNLPALAQTLPTEFVFLTGRRDEGMIREAVGYRQLSKICPVSFHAIDELVTESNHSTTVTFAFAGAVRRTAEATPKAAIGTVERVVAFAWLRRPETDAALGAPQFEGPGAARMRHHLPVETIATEIDEAASILEIGAKRIERFGGVVFGVLAGEHDSVVREQLRAFAMHVVIGDHLKVDALARQQIGDVAVGRDPIEAGAIGARVDEMDLIDPLVDQGPAHRRHDDAAAVRMEVVR